MPLFIIISGMFFKQKDIKSFIINIIKGLIAPYVISIFCIDMIEYFVIKGEHDILSFIIGYIKQIGLSYSLLKSNMEIKSLGVLWFVPFLAMIRIIFYALKKISKDNEISLLLGTILVTYAGYILGIKGYWLPFSLDVAMASVIFYYIGYILNKFNILERIIKDNKVMIILLLIWVLGIKFGNIELAIRHYANGLFCFVSAISGSVCIIKISSFIERKMKFIAKILKWYGKNSMYILIFHSAEWRLINYNFLMVKNKTIYKVVLSTLKVFICTIFTLLYNNIKEVIKRLNKDTTNNF